MNRKVITKSSSYILAIQSAIIINDIEQFKNLLSFPHESLSQNQRYSIAYSMCLEAFSTNFLHCLIFEFNLREDLIEPRYITNEVRALFAQRKADELGRELEQKEGRDKKIKV